MFGISRYQGAAPVAMSGAQKFPPPSPPVTESTPTAEDRADIGSAPAASGSSGLGSVLIGAGVLAMTGLVAATLAGLFATPLVVAVGAIASVLAVGAGGLMQTSGSDSSSPQSQLNTQMTSDGQLRQAMPLGTPSSLGGVSQSLDLSSGQVRQEVNVGNGWYLDPSTGQMVFHF